MSNLLKSKFLLGVMIVAVMLVGVVAVNAPTASAASCTITSTLRLGSKGTQVQCLQSALGLTADGDFGPHTKAAVMSFQTSHGLVADGIFGPASRAAWTSGSMSMGTMPVGCTSTAGFSPTTGASCSTGSMATSLPLGCTSTAGFSPTTGASCATGATTITNSGPISAALSSDTPPSGYIIGGQATADLAHFVFSGSGVLNSVTLQRTGISDQNTLSNVYLYQGNTRLTDGYSFNSTGTITMNNLNIPVNGSVVISVKGDVAVGNSASTLGVTLTGFTAGTTATNVSIAANQMYYGTGSLATTYLGANTVTGGSVTVNTGTSQFTVWSAPLQVNTRTIELKSANFRIVGSAPANSLSNVNLYIDGVSAGKVATMGMISGSNYAMFDFSAAPINLTTGSHTLALEADVTGGASYTVQVSLQQAADLTLFDPQVGVNIASLGAGGAAFGSNNAANITINAGTASVVIDPTFQQQTNITGGATNIDIGKFQVTGYGEPVKVQTLTVLPVMGSSPTLSSGTCVANTSCSLNNVTVFFNGSQVGSQQPWTGTGVLTFNLGSQMIIPAGSISTIEIRADLQNASGFNYTSGSVGVDLQSINENAAYGNNAQGQSSHQTINFPASQVVGTTLTIQTGLLAVSKNTGFASQSVGPNTSAVKIGSYILQNQSTSEPVRVTSLLVGITQANSSTVLTGTGSAGVYPALTNFSGLYVAVNGVATTPVQPAGSNTFSVNNVTIAPGATAEVDVYANTSSTADSSSFSTNLVVTSIGQNSNVSIGQNGTSLPGTAVAGQNMTLASGTVTTPTSSSLLTANSTAQQFVPAGNGGATGATIAAFQFAATGGSATISEMKFTVNSGDANVAGTWAAITTGTGKVFTPTVGANANLFAVGDVVQVLGSTSNGLGTVSAVTGSTSVTVAISVAATGTGNGLRVIPATVTSISVNGVSAPVVNGIAYLTGLNLAVPNGGGGLTQNVYVSYAPVGTNGVMTNATSRVALEYLKYTSGGTTATICTSFINCGGTAMTAVSAPTMKLVGSVPTLALVSPSTTLTTGNTEVADVTVTANAKGDITLNSLPISVTPTSATLTSTSAASELVVEDQNGNPVTTTFSAFGSTSTGGTSTIFFGSCTTAACTGNTGYRISAGTSQTFRIFLSFSAVSNPSGAHTSSVTLSLGSSDLLGWVDTGGNASATTGTDVAGSSAITVSNKFKDALNATATPGFFYNYPTTTASVSS